MCAVCSLYYIVSFSFVKYRPLIFMCPEIPIYWPVNVKFGTAEVTLGPMCMMCYGKVHVNPSNELLLRGEKIAMWVNLIPALLPVTNNKGDGFHWPVWHRNSRSHDNGISTMFSFVMSQCCRLTDDWSIPKTALAIASRSNKTYENNYN